MIAHGRRHTSAPGGVGRELPRHAGRVAEVESHTVGRPSRNERAETERETDRARAGYLRHAGFFPRGGHFGERRLGTALLGKRSWFVVPPLGGFRQTFLP